MNGRYLNQEEDGLCGLRIGNVAGEVFEDGPLLNLFTVVEYLEALVDFREFFVDAERIDFLQGLDVERVTSRWRQ